MASSYHLLILLLLCCLFFRCGLSKTTNEVKEAPLLEICAFTSNDSVRGNYFLVEYHGIPFNV